MSDDSRTCEFCGCITNARLRMCCDTGYAMDGGSRLSNLLQSARIWFDSLTPEQQLAHRADQAVSFAYHCAKSFRAKGGTFEEFVQLYGEELKRRYLEKVELR